MVLDKFDILPYDSEVGDADDDGIPDKEDSNPKRENKVGEEDMFTGIHNHFSGVKRGSPPFSVGTMRHISRMQKALGDGDENDEMVAATYKKAAAVIRGIIRSSSTAMSPYAAVATREVTMGYLQAD